MKIYYSHTYSGSKGDSRKLLEKAISEYTGDEMLAHDLVNTVGTTGDFGKPVIDGFDAFSVSHSGRTWAVLISGGVCGLDIQYRRRSNNMKIAERFFDPADAARIRQTEEDFGAEAAVHEFLRLWTRREALIKAAGGSVAASDVPSVSDRIVMHQGVQWTIEDIEIPACSADDELNAAICLEGLHEELPPVIFEELDRELI